MFGAHLSIAGGLHNALLLAEKLGAEALQVFTKNQQQWACQSLPAQAIREWARHRRRLAFRYTISHGSYLINLASPDEALWRRSIELFAEEIRRCQLLGIPYLVTHPGSHMGAGDAAGCARVAAALDQVYQAVPARNVTVCLEATAGQGTSIGCRLEHLAETMEQVRSRVRLGICLDTAHLFAAGYDFRGRRYGRFRRELERVLGLSRVKVWHLNDAKKDLGSRVDRHEHIGRGFIGLEGFRPIVRDRAFANVPKIIETPKGLGPRGRDWDRINLEALRSLA